MKNRMVLAVIGVGIFATTAYALPNQEVSTSYYSDATHRVLVGESILTCGGGRTKWGKVTRFQLKDSIPCGRGRRTAITPAATLLMHSDPHLACQRRCKIRYPLHICAPNEDCGAELRACEQACDDLLKPPADQ